MSTGDNKAIVTRFSADVWNSGNLATVEDYIAADYIRHDPGIPMQVRGPEGIKQLVRVFRNAFPDVHFTPEIIVGELDKVVVLFRVSGSHQGELMGMPATGKPIAITSIEIFRFADGKIAEQWVAVDNMGMLQQLGAMPVAHHS
jgi:steroid delta-isomerase-like uncharacterized protein